MVCGVKTLSNFQHNNIRNLAIIAHVDHGKTTLTSAITKVLAAVAVLGAACWLLEAEFG